MPSPAPSLPLAAHSPPLKKPPSSRPAGPPRLLSPLVLVVLALAVLLLCVASTPSPLLLSARPTPAVTPDKCPHVVLFSSARHGSTWFIDSVEKCRYSRSEKRLPSEPFAPDVFKATEPWKHVHSPIYNLSGADTARYVSDKCSVKVFSSTMANNKAGVEDMIVEGAKLRLPFVILRREPRATYQSLRVAKHSGVWNGNRETAGVDNAKAEQLVDDAGFEKYKATMERHYSRIEHMLVDAGVDWADTIDYDDVKENKYIRLENNDCYVRNCNFE